MKFGSGGDGWVPVQPTVDSGERQQQQQQQQQQQHHASNTIASPHYTNVQDPNPSIVSAKTEEEETDRIERILSEEFHAIGLHLNQDEIGPDPIQSPRTRFVT